MRYGGLFSAWETRLKRGKDETQITKVRSPFWTISEMVVLMVPRYQRKTIGELQHEYLTNLLQCNKNMTIKQAQYRVAMINQYAAGLYINLKGFR